MVYCKTLDFVRVIFQVHILTQQRISAVLDATKMKKKKVRMFYLLGQNQNPGELALILCLGHFCFMSILTTPLLCQTSGGLLSVFTMSRKKEP